MENYTITKEQILELDKFAVQGCDNVIRDRLKLFFPEAFKKVFTVGKWYKIDKNIFYCTEISERGTLYGYGIFEGNWKERFNDGGVFCACNSFASKERLTEASNEEVKEALKNEVIKRFGKDWETAKIEKCLVHGNPDFGYISLISNNEIWNKNGCIYKNGVFTEPLKIKVITMDKAEKILSKKYGQKVEIK